jgi:hypothetical protein
LECVQEDTNGYITKADFNKKFCAWCIENRYRVMSEISLSKSLKERGYESSTKFFQWLYDGKGGNARIWLNVKWRD